MVQPIKLPPLTRFPEHLPPARARGPQCPLCSHTAPTSSVSGQHGRSLSGLTLFARFGAFEAQHTEQIDVWTSLRTESVRRARPSELPSMYQPRSYVSYCLQCSAVSVPLQGVDTCTHAKRCALCASTAFCNSHCVLENCLIQGEKSHFTITTC